MASLSSVSNSSNTVSSLMNSANMISGLASGLDTEGMIEQLVKSYQTKINQYNQKITKTEWKQDAYRSIISKMVGFSNKYTSYTSNTNLTSPGFFNNSVKVITKGEFKDSVTASGKTGSDISLDAVHQLATAAQYRTKSNLVTGETGIITGSSMDLFTDDPAKKVELSNLKGGLSLTYGSKTISLSFNENTDVDAMKDIRSKLAKEQGVGEADVKDADVLAGLINQKLAGETIVFNNGNSESADKRIKATANSDGRIVFEEQGSGKNGVYISGASGNIGAQFGLSEDDLKDAAEKKLTVIDTHRIKGADGQKGLTRKLNGIELLAEKTMAAGENGVVMNMSLDGSTKQIKMPDVRTANGEYYLNGDKVEKSDFAKKYTEALGAEVQKAFKDKVTVENKGENGELKLEFKVKNEGSDLVINADAGDALGIGRAATSYLNTGKTLKDLMGEKLSGLTPVPEPEYKTDYDGNILKDKNGNPIPKLDESGNIIYKKDENGNPVPKLDEKTGKPQYDFTLNGVKIGTYTEDTQLSKILSDINSNKDAGVSVSYSQTTQNFTFKAKETGADSEIKMGEGLAQAIFGSTEISSESPKFSEAYGVQSWVDKVTFQFDGDHITLNKFNKDSSIEDIAKRLNVAFSGSERTASYNKYTGQLEVKDKNGKAVDFKAYVDDEDLGRVSFNFKEEYAPKVSYTPGQDAKFTVTVNGETKNMVRSSNSVNIDGLTINMNDTFNGYENKDGTPAVDSAGRPKNAVTFQSKTDSDKIIDAIKSMVNDYNTMMSEIKSAYSTMPYQKSNGSFANYEPLTDEDREGMSESAIERYEEKAKQGILFGDRTLSGLYTKMNQAFSFSNRADVDTLREMGISVSYNVSDGAQAVTIDEDKLRAMLDSDPDRVANLFTKTDGVMDRMKTQLDAYAKTTGEPKGTLIQQAGSPLSSLSLMSNSWQKQIDNYNTQIEKWQDKLTSQVEKYTKQFSRLEQLIQQMNSQSSTLSGMMGG